MEHAALTNGASFPMTKQTHKSLFLGPGKLNWDAQHEAGTCLFVLYLLSNIVSFTKVKVKAGNL